MVTVIGYDVPEFLILDDLKIALLDWWGGKIKVCFLSARWRGLMIFHQFLVLDSSGGVELGKHSLPTTMHLD